MRHLIASTVLLFALAGCKDDPQSPQYWEKKLSAAKRVREKTHILSELRDSGHLNPSLLPMLNASLASEKAPEVKGEIARLLGTLKDPSSIEPLMEATDLGNTDRSGNTMNREIAAALGQIGDAKATPALLRLLKSKDSYVRIEAINALGNAHATEAVDPLQQIVADDTADPFLVKKAIQSLGEIGDPRPVPTLLKMLFKEKRGITYYPESSFALFQIGQPASEALLKVIRGDDASLMAWAKENNILVPAMYAKSAQILGDLNEPRAVQPLLDKLAFQSEYLDIQLLVRMRAADALGRLRAQEAIKPLVAVLEATDEPTALHEYATALIRLGSRDAIPGLLKAAAVKDWDTREHAILCLAMLGDDRDGPDFEKLIKAEDAATGAECKKEPDTPGCKEPSKMASDHVETIRKLQKLAIESGQCKANLGCWGGKLEDPQPLLRERAALEIGRSRQADKADELVKRIGESKAEVRSTIILALSWLVHDSKEAAAKARGSLAPIEKQLSSDKGKLEFVRVNEDLQRLVATLRKANT